MARTGSRERVANGALERQQRIEAGALRQRIVLGEVDLLVLG